MSDYRSSQPHRRKPPTRRRPDRRTTDREVVQSDELSSTSGARLISSDNPYDPSLNPHTSAAFPAVTGAGNPHPKSPAGRARQQYEASQTGDIPRVAPAHANLHPAHTGQQAPVMGMHTEAQPQAPAQTQAHVQAQAQPQPQRQTQSVDPASAFVPATAQLNSDPHSTGAHQTYQDYTAASGRYKARPHVNGTPKHGGHAANYLPVNAEAQHSRRKSKLPRVIAAVVIAIAVIFGGCFAFNQIVYAGPIEATVNGEKMTLQGSERSIEGLLDNGIVSVTPGNYVAVDNSVIREGDGQRCSALINEQQVDLGAHINEGDSVVVSNGTDVMEEFVDSAPTVLPAGYTREGDWGALHVFLPGQDGEKVTRTGSESGITIEQITKEKIDERLVYYNANTGGEKVVALTFDDGPWDGTTAQILDILKENGAKATFYTIGNQVSEHADVIKRMANEGHEIATHTWDHADGSGRGVSLDLMSTEERQQEVEKGMAVIEEVAGKVASVFFRAPGGNFGESTANDLMSLIDGEIGWNVDTEDWRRPGAEVIAERIKSVQPGGVILMHDGGGDRSQTVAGLREGLAYLKSQGYKFVTITELIEQYPYQAS